MLVFGDSGRLVGLLVRVVEGHLLVEAEVRRRLESERFRTVTDALGGKETGTAQSVSARAVASPG